MYSLLNAKSHSDHNLHFYLIRESLYKVSAGTAKWPSAKSQVVHTDNSVFRGDDVFTVLVGTFRVQTVSQATAMEVANKAKWSKPCAQGNDLVVEMPD